MDAGLAKHLKTAIFQASKTGKGLKMSEEKGARWLNYLAITTVVLAVFATLATFNGGKYSTKSVISQNQASNKWAHFQSKSIKSYQNELQAEKLALDLKAMSPENAARVQDDFRKAIDSCKAKVARYEKEKELLSVEAKALEDLRDDCQCHGKYFGFAIIFLQIGILLCAVAGFIKNKALWLASIALGVIGVYFFVQGFYAKPLPLKLPKLPVPSLASPSAAQPK